MCIKHAGGQQQIGAAASSSLAQPLTLTQRLQILLQMSSVRDEE